MYNAFSSSQYFHKRVDADLTFHAYVIVIVRLGAGESVHGWCANVRSCAFANLFTCNGEPVFCGQEKVKNSKE